MYKRNDFVRNSGRASLSQRSFVGLPTMAHYSKVGLDTQVALRPEAEHCTCVSRWCVYIRAELAQQSQCVLER